MKMGPGIIFTDKMWLDLNQILMQSSNMKNLTLLLFLRSSHPSKMISPPKFKKDLSSSSILWDKSYDNLHSEEMPCSPESHSTSLPALFQLLESALKLIKVKEIRHAREKLEQLQEKLKINKRMLKSQQKLNLEGIYIKIQFACLYHLSFCYNHFEEEKQLLENNQKAVLFIHEFRKAYDGKKNQKELKLKVQYADNVQNHENYQNKVAYLSTKESTSTNLFPNNESMHFLQNKVKLEAMFAQVLLFSCFKLSRMDEHEQAFHQAREARDIIVKIINSLEIEDEIFSYHPQIMKMKKPNDKIQFKRIIGRKANPVIKQIKNDITVDDIEKSENLKKIKGTISCWRRNPENSKKDLKAQRKDCYINSQSNQTEGRTLLGVKSMKMLTTSIYTNRIVKKNPECIKDLLTLQPVSFKQMCQGENFVFELTPEKLKEKLEILCSAYFCMGIQLWNLETDNEEGMNSFSNSRITRDELSEEMYKKSQFFLLKSIGIVVSYLKEYESLLDNLVEVFQRKFEGSMMSIPEENSKNQTSLSLSDIRRSTKNRLSHKLLEQQEKSKDWQINKYFMKETNLQSMDHSELIMSPDQVYYNLETNEKKKLTKKSKSKSKQKSKSKSNSKEKSIHRNLQKKKKHDHSSKKQKDLQILNHSSLSKNKKKTKELKRSNIILLNSNSNSNDQGVNRKRMSPQIQYRRMITEESLIEKSYSRTNPLSKITSEERIKRILQNSLEEKNNLRESFGSKGSLTKKIFSKKKNVHY